MFPRSISITKTDNCNFARGWRDEKTNKERHDGIQIITGSTITRQNLYNGRKLINVKLLLIKQKAYTTTNSNNNYYVHGI